MYIKSSFKDYYDFINSSYGIDKKYTFDRKIVNLKDTLYPFEVKTFPSDLGIPFMEKYSFKKSENDKDYEFVWVLVCGKIFSIYKEKYNNTPWSIIEPDSPILEFLGIKTTNKIITSFFEGWRKDLDFYRGFYSEVFLNLNKEAKSPIVIICNTNRYYRKNFGIQYIPGSPELKQIKGFVSLYPPEQIYQDIYYFLSNQVNGSPDINPPVELSDKSKILEHGFDLKKSFRHRK